MTEPTSPPAPSTSPDIIVPLREGNAWVAVSTEVLARVIGRLGVDIVPTPLGCGRAGSAA